MNIIEQRIWDYLDGNCNEQESKEIEHLVETDPVYRDMYSELISLNQDLGKMDLDQPSMAFTRNVMDRVSLLPVPGSIRSLVDKRIIYGIASFFIISILALLTLLFFQVDWAKPVADSLPELEIPALNYSTYFNSTYMRVFLFADLILGLYILDSIMRKKILTK